MSKTVLIILAAVVILIVIVVVTGMHFLRADDDEDFDGQPADSGRHADDDIPAGRARARRDGDRGWTVDREPPMEAGQQDGRTGRGRPTHAGAGRDANARVPVGSREYELAEAGRHGGASGKGRNGRPSASGRDGRSSASGRDGRSAANGRDGRSAANGRDGRSAADRLDREFDADGREHDGRGGREATRPGARKSDARKSDGGFSRRDDLPAVRPRPGRGKRDDDGEWPSTEWDELSDVDYWAELASDRPLTTTAQPAASAGRPERKPVSPRGAEQRPRREAESTADGLTDPGRHSGRGSAGRHKDRRQPGSELSARSAAEVPLRPGSDLPLRQPRSQSVPDRSVPDRSVPDRSVLDRSAAAALSAGLSAAPLGRGPAPAAAATPSPSIPFAPAVPASPSSAPTLAMLANMGSAADDSRPRDLNDDDPLTSPSFPRVTADDSRSYRRRRPGTGGDHVGPRDQTVLRDQTISRDQAVLRDHAASRDYSLPMGTLPGDSDFAYATDFASSTDFSSPADVSGSHRMPGTSDTGGHRRQPISSDTGNHRRPGYSSDSGSYGRSEPTSDSGSYARAGITSDSGSYPRPGRTDYHVPAVYQPADYPVADTQATVAYPRPAAARTDLPGDVALPASLAAGLPDYAAPDYSAPALPDYSAPALPDYSASASTTQYAAAYAGPTLSGNDYRPTPPVPAGHHADASTVAYQRPSAASVPSGTGYRSSLPARDMPGDSGYQSSAASGSSLPAGAGYLGSASPSAYTASADGYAAPQPRSQAAPDPAPGHLGYGSAGQSDSTASGYLPNLEASLPSPGLPSASDPAGGYNGLAGPGGHFTGDGYLPQPPQAGSGYGNGFQHGTGAPGGGDSYPAGQFHQAPYEPARYPSPAREAGGYTGTDPYAIDPYGTPRYGHGGF